MFVELMPLLGDRTVMITVSRTSQNSIRVNFIPSRKKEDENAGLATPLSFSGTPEELDRALGSSLASYVEENLRLQTTLTEAKAEMEDQISGNPGACAARRSSAPSRGPS